MTPGPVCYGVTGGHLARTDVHLYEIGLPGGRRAFMCDGCRDNLAGIGMRLRPVEPVERAQERRATPTRRRYDSVLGRHGLDRRSAP